MAGTAQAADARVQPPDDLFYAGIMLRSVAFILDLMVSTSVFALFVAAGGLQILARSDWGDRDPSSEAVWVGVLIASSFFLILPLYFSLLWWWRGQTLGMMAVSIAVADRHGHVPTLKQAILRTLAFPLSFLPLMAGITTIFVDHEYRALHDMIAGTVVVEIS
jgi:uncharacterized RDD family membrane protein YckC